MQALDNEMAPILSDFLFSGSNALQNLPEIKKLQRQRWDLGLVV